MKDFLLAPMIWLLNQLTFGKKIFLLGLVLFSITATAIYLVIDTSNREVSFAEKERVGVQYISKMNQVFVDLWSNDQTAAEKDMAKLAALEALHEETLATKEKWSSLKKLWDKNKNKLFDTKSPEHRQFMDEYIGLVSYVGDKSNLILDPDLDSYYLMDSFVLRLLPLSDALTQLSIFIDKNTRQYGLNSQDTDSLMALLTLTQDKFNLTKGNLDVVYRETKDPSIKKRLDPIFKSYEKHLTEIFSLTVNSKNNPNSVEMEMFENMVKQGHEQTNQLFVKTALELDQLLQKRQENSMERTYFPCGIILAIFLLTLYALIGFDTAVKQSISKLVEVSAKVADGDLNARAELKTKDELNSIGFSYNQMVESLSQLILNLQRGIETLLVTSQNLSQTSAEMKNTAFSMTEASQETTVSIEEVNSHINTVAVAMEQASANIKDISNNSNDVEKNNRQVGDAVSQVAQNMENVSQSTEHVSLAVNTVASAIEEMSASLAGVSQHAVKAAEIAANGKNTAEQTHQTIKTLRHSAAQINSVIDVIRSIASQTNLLALNATIEAASAGDAGKGFAVVANEVKELAKQSANATEDIRQKVEEIQTSTEAAVKAIDDITKVITEMNSINTVISSAVNEQTSTINEISHTVANAAEATSVVSVNVKQTSETTKDVTEKLDNALEGMKEMTLHLQEMSKGTSQITQNSSLAANRSMLAMKGVKQVEETAFVTNDAASKIEKTSSSLATLANDLTNLAGVFKV